MESDLAIAERRARDALGKPQIRNLGTVYAEQSIAFARAAHVVGPEYLNPQRPDFSVHPMYLLSMLRGHEGGMDSDYRSDGMFSDEVPGTEGLNVRLMAGGQSIEFIANPVVGESVRATRYLDTVTFKGRESMEFLLLEMVKEYISSGVGMLARVRETFIVR